MSNLKLLKNNNFENQQTLFFLSNQIKILTFKIEEFNGILNYMNDSYIKKDICPFISMKKNQTIEEKNKVEELYIHKFTNMLNKSNQHLFSNPIDMFLKQNFAKEACEIHNVKSELLHNSIFYYIVVSKYRVFIKNQKYDFSLFKIVDEYNNEKLYYTESQNANNLLNSGNFLKECHEANDIMSLIEMKIESFKEKRDNVLKFPIKEKTTTANHNSKTIINEVPRKSGLLDFFKTMLITNKSDNAS